MKKPKAKKATAAPKSAIKGTPMSMDNVLWQLVNRPKKPSPANRAAKTKTKDEP